MCVYPSMANTAPPKFWTDDLKFRKGEDGQILTFPSRRLLAAEPEIAGSDWLPVGSSDYCTCVNACENGSDCDDDDCDACHADHHRPAGPFNLATCPSLRSWITRWQAAVVEDGSLPENGFEINTAPAGGYFWQKQVAELGTVLQSIHAFTSAKCGCHIHADARDLNWFDLRRLIRLYIALEPVLYGMVPERRRTNRYCQPCARAYRPILSARRPREIKTIIRENFYKDTVTETPTPSRDAYTDFPELYKPDCARLKRADANRWKRARGEKYNENRYYALNIHSWLYRGTVELRLPPGTTRAENIHNWGFVFARIVDTAARSSEKQMDALLAPVQASALPLGHPSASETAVLQSILPSDLWQWCKQRLTTYSTSSIDE